MLGVSNGSGLAELWDAAKSRAALPAPAEEFFAAIGPVANYANCRRKHERFYLRCRAIIKVDIWQMYRAMACAWFRRSNCFRNNGSRCGKTCNITIV